MKLLILIYFLIINTAVFAGNHYLQDDITVYFDCNDCDRNYLVRNLEHVNFAREPQVSDVHVLVTEQSTGGGGSDYRFEFIGRHQFEDIRFELTYNTLPTNTRMEIRAGMLELIRSGLQPFIFANSKSVSNLEDTVANTGASIDPWDYWVFEISSRFDYGKEISRREFEIENEIDIERVTEQWRIRIDLEHEYEENKISQDEGDFISSLNRGGLYGSVVRSMGQHWSTGVFGALWSNTVNNILTGGRLHAALEFNIFPYEVSHRKEFTIAYRIGPRYFNYQEETIYNETEEQLFNQSMLINYEQLRPWGRLEWRLEGFNYLHDVSKNRLEVESDLFLRLVKGLFVRFGGEFQLIHDQIYLPKGDATLEEILLNRKALATDFEFEFNVGLSYTFGAISNNVVNTRL